MGRAKRKVQWITKLNKVYYSPKSPGGFSGVAGLKRVTGYKTSKIKDWLEKQDAYTLHKPAYRKFERRKVVVTGPNHQWAADLVDVSALRKNNEDNTFLLTVIDVFTKKAACRVLLRKSGPCVAKAFENILVNTDTPPRKLQTDKGSEFYNKNVKPLLKRYNIDIFSTENDDIKSCIVERFNRTLRSRMWKYFTANNTTRYIEILPDLIDSYNNTYNSSIKMTPNSVNDENKHNVWNTLYGDYKRPLKAKLTVGDSVRISKNSRLFTKGYTTNWSEELFTVSSVLRTIPVTYTIKEYSGDLISGTFYERELQKSQKETNLFEIEEIIDTRLLRGQKQSLVKWKGYPSSYNEWKYDKELIRSNRK